MTIYETLDALEAVSRRALGRKSVKATAALWNLLARQFAGNPRLLEQLPVMAEKWYDGRTIHSILSGIKFREFERADSMMESSLDHIATIAGTSVDDMATVPVDIVADTLDNMIDAAELSQVELAYINLVRQGYTQMEIADKLQVSQAYVSKALSTILEKIRNCGYNS